jgi:hypothetical protein
MNHDGNFHRGVTVGLLLVLPFWTALLWWLL